MIWSQRQLAKLAQKSTTSLRSIEDLITRQGTTANGWLVWGQFLDQEHTDNQHGIYGTSSAVQILALAGYSQEHATVKSASGALQDLVAKSSDPAFPQVDMENSFKVAYLLEATNAGAKELINLDPLESRLVADIASSDGWGNHRDDNTPRVLPTAHLLVALSRSQSFGNSATAVRVVSWLCQRVHDDESLGVVQNAMAFLAINSTLTANPVAEELRTTAMADIRRRLEPLAHDHVNLDNVSEHYALNEDGVPRHLYMFYLRSSIVARALLAIPESDEKHYATRVVAAICRNVQQNGGFRSPSTGRISTVDQLEVSRLLHAFADAHDASPSSLLPQFARTIESTIPRRVATSAALLVAGGASGYMAAATDNPTLEAGGVAVSVVTLGLLSTAIWGWTGTKL